MNLTRDRRIVPILASLGLLALVIGMLTTQPGRAAGPWHVAPGGDDGHDAMTSRTAGVTTDAATAKTFSALTGIGGVQSITEGPWGKATIPRPPDRTLELHRSQPEITVAPLVLSATLGPAEESTHTLTISNGGSLDLSWALGENPVVVWLAEEPVSGTVTPDGVAAVAVAFDADGLSDGVYTSTLQVSSNDPDEPQIDVSVMLTVAPCIPVAGADFSHTPSSPQGGEPVKFEGSVSQGSGVLDYRWSFGDGDGDTGQRVFHRFPLSVMTQTYTVVLTVSGCANQDTVSRDVMVRPSGEIIYVDVDATGIPDGNSWQTAYTDLQSALTEASSGDEIWVAEGTYRPSVEHGGSGERFKSFQLKNGVALYGCFAGMETSLDERAWALRETILSGDIGIEGDDSDNCYHVFYHPADTALDNTAILDRFTITGGKADGSYPHDAGGGMYNDAASPTLTNCTFEGNSAYRGGGMANSYSSPALTNCTFSGNSAVLHGGGMYNEFLPPTLTNSILWGDTPDEIFNYDADGWLVVTYSDIQGGHEGEGNIDAYPWFVDPTNGDFHLGACSPCIDRGDNLAPDLPDFDFEGDVRIWDGDGDGVTSVDMGVDEVAIVGTCFHVYLPLTLRER